MLVPCSFILTYLKDSATPYFAYVSMIYVFEKIKKIFNGQSAIAA